jgi:hypothetical protein
MWTPTVTEIKRLSPHRREADLAASPASAVPSADGATTSARREQLRGN